MPESTTPHGGATNTEPASVSVNLHARPGQVHAVDLSDQSHDDLVSLRFGDLHASVVMLGTLDRLSSLVAAAARRLNDVAAARNTDSPQGGAR